MRLPDTTSRAWLCMYPLLISAFLMQAPLASGQEQPSSLQAPLAPAVRSRLAEAAQGAAVAPWQRDLMLEMVRGGVTGAANELAAPPRGLATPFSGIAAIDGAWTGVTAPSARVHHTAIYDPVRDRVIMFGGQDASGLRNDVWLLSLAGSPVWSELSPTGVPPSARYLHTAIYDPVRDRMVVFGGLDASGIHNDVWALTLAGSPAWTQIAPLATPPSARDFHSAIYDPVRDRMLVFGGYSDAGFRNDLWALSLAGSPTWSLITPVGVPPSPRYLHTAIYDSVRDRMVVFGGLDASGYRNDVWAVSLPGNPVWSAPTPAGTPPSPRNGHSAIYDAAHDRMVVFGGYDGVSYFNDVRVLAFAGSPTWSLLAPSGSPPSTRAYHTAIYDPVRIRVVAIGGYNSSSGLDNDVWALTLGASPAWGELAAAVTVNPPSARAYHTAIYDPVRDRMVVFGGSDGTSLRNDVWVLSLSGSPAWTALAPSGVKPSGRYGHTAIYDPVRDRMVVFGGSDGSNFFNDVWALSLAGSPAWSQLAAAAPNPPNGRFQHTANYDPVRDRMVMFGGYDGTSLRNDVWALSLAGSPAWSQLAPVGTSPTARRLHVGIYDPVRDRIVVFGGLDFTSFRYDVWSLSLTASPAWSELAPAGVPPSGRYGDRAIYDPVRDRMVLCGGIDGSGRRNDVWALALAGSPAWTELAPAGIPPSPRSYHSAIYDPVRGHMVVFGGLDTGYRNDLWALAWASPVSVPGDGVSRRFEFAPPRPNPSRGETTLDFELSEPGRVVLDVFDAQGRRVKRVADAWFAAGRHAMLWPGDDEDGRAIGAGMYFIRMQVGSVQATRRTVRVR